MSKAVVFFADGTEECEALLVVDLLRRAKVEVLVASASGRRELVSSHKIRVTADALAEELRRARETERRESSVRLALGSCAAVFLLALFW